MSGKNFVEVMDTTLRDGEQTQGVAFSPEEKLSIAKVLLKDVKVDRIEIANARVSKGELEAVKKMTAWAKEDGLLDRLEVMGFVDGEKSVNWIEESGAKTMNLLTKGSLKHCKQQLRKEPNEHFADIAETVKIAKEKGLKVNVYLEDWSNGMLDSKEYVFDLLEALEKLKIGRVFLADTLGVLSPSKTRKLVKETVEKFPDLVFEFHAHNDYGLAVANTLEAVEAGAKGAHVTVNGLGERTGNAPLDEVVASIKDHTKFKTEVKEKKNYKAGKMVETFSGKRLSENKPISGESVFTQTAGIHADGDKKGDLYASNLMPERFGRQREYALGKLSGKASLEMNLRKLGIELNDEQKKDVLARIVQLGDKKEKITPEDLPYIVADVLQTPEQQKIKIVNCVVSSGKGITPNASFTLEFNGEKISASGVGDGGYDAFMSALKDSVGKLGLELPQLVDYEVRIPPGGKTDALVETTISWGKNGSRFKTIGVDSDQVMAAIKATEKMLNIVARNGK
ncbi:MAG: 2-isopropylmalate synthase [Candidatus Diapherotrites archaeon]|uniref:2-isopropylmalate synthase n=1 Tax=Candidatus Iainarchaeum sp. TaxID=3101447 RepID=A0A2D6M168_9ARCH|nr:2-isopropylmalate synthase [Candidatus Diapherotrites archaeon]|tara:strand:- start:9131 stop:10660 length:1530 start_codon:yes stop_codon:yes gene_type:complete